MSPNYPHLAVTVIHRYKPLVSVRSTDIP